MTNKSLLSSFEVRDLITGTAFVETDSGPWVETMVSVYHPRQEDVLLHVLQMIVMTLETAKIRKGDWKTAKALVTASELRVEEGRKYYEAAQGVNIPVYEFMKQALGQKAQLPSGVKSIEDFTLEEAIFVALGAMALEEKRIESGISVDALRGMSHESLGDIFSKGAANDNE